MEKVSITNRVFMNSYSYILIFFLCGIGGYYLKQSIINNNVLFRVLFLYFPAIIFSLLIYLKPVISPQSILYKKMLIYFLFYKVFFMIGMFLAIVAGMYLAHLEFINASEIFALFINLIFIFLFLIFSIVNDFIVNMVNVYCQEELKKEYQQRVP